MTITRAMATLRRLLLSMFLPRGWTTDGEGYFNDQLALMVWRRLPGEPHFDPARPWAFGGNGGRWPQGYDPGAALVSARVAMRVAEQLGALLVLGRHEPN